MQYFWQAQHWMDPTCTTVPRAHLRLVRTGVREISVVDVRQIAAAPNADAYAQHLHWLSPSGFLAVPPRPSATVKAFASRSSGGVGARATHHHPCHRWRRRRCGRHLLQLRRAELWQRHVAAATGWTRIRRTRSGRVGCARRSATTPPPSPKPKRKKACRAAVDPLQQPFVAKWDQSKRMIYWLYYWLPIYGPLQKSVATPPADGGGGTKKRSGVWTPQRLGDDARPSSQLPGTLATFGLVVGKQYTIPAALGVGAKIGRAHELQALRCDLVYATQQLASTGVDEPRLCSSFEATYQLDNEQSDGRCARVLPPGAKQDVYLKNEFIDPWSHYQQAAWKHNTAYRMEGRAVALLSHRRTAVMTGGGCSNKIRASNFFIVYSTRLFLRRRQRRGGRMTRLNGRATHGARVGLGAPRLEAGLVKLVRALGRHGGQHAVAQRLEADAAHGLVARTRRHRARWRGCGEGLLCVCAMKGTLWRGTRRARAQSAHWTLSRRSIAQSIVGDKRHSRQCSH